MDNKIYTFRFLLLKCGMLLTLTLLCLLSNAQNARGRRPARPTTAATSVKSDTLKRDTLAVDSAKVQAKKLSPSAINSMVTYSSKDSAVNDISRRYTYLFGDAVVQYRTLVKQIGPVGDTERLVDIVVGNQNTQALILRQTSYIFLNIPYRNRINTCKRLIKQYQII